MWWSRNYNQSKINKDSIQFPHERRFSNFFFSRILRNWQVAKWMKLRLFSSLFVFLQFAQSQRIPHVRWIWPKQKPTFHGVTKWFHSPVLFVVFIYKRLIRTETEQIYSILNKQSEANSFQTCWLRSVFFYLIFVFCLVILIYRGNQSKFHMIMKIK